jgi:hypothetical protein
MSDLSRCAPLLFCCGHALLSAIILSTTTKASAIRFISIPCLAYLAYQHFATTGDFSSNAHWMSLSSSFSFIQFIHSIGLLAITRVDVNDLIRETKLQPSANIFTLTLSALRLVIDTRAIGTRWQGKNAPVFPHFFQNRQSPSRLWFLVRQAALFSWEYLFLDLFDSIFLERSAEENEHLRGLREEYLYLDTISGPWIVRSMMNLAMWFTVYRVFLDLIVRFLSLVFVSTGISSPSDWPPFFGSMLDAYTLRNFWG